MRKTILWAALGLLGTIMEIGTLVRIAAIGFHQIPSSHLNLTGAVLILGMAFSAIAMWGLANSKRPSEPEAAKPEEEGFTTIVCEFDAKQYPLIQSWIESGLTDSTKGVMNSALTLYEWTIQELAAGQLVGSIDEENKVFKEPIMPALEYVKRQSLLAN